MPSFHLSRPEALALTLYLETGLPTPPGGGWGRVRRLREAHPQAGPEAGRRIFLALDCAGCHGGTDVPAWKSAPDLSEEGSSARRGWLASWLARPSAVRPFGFYPGTGTRMPDFGLSSRELGVLVDYLAGRGAGTAEAGGTAGRRGAGGGAAAPPAIALSPFRRAQAARLLRGRAACLGCHAAGGRGGRIAPDLATARVRRPDAYVWSMVRDPAGDRPRSIMPRGPEPPGRDTLFFRLLVTGGSPLGGERSGGTRTPSASADPRDGYLDLVANPPGAPDRWILQGDEGPTTTADRYRRLCAPCHGAEGRGDGFNAPYLPVPPARHADSAAMAARTDARLFDAVHGGGRVLGRSARMPAFGRTLDRDAIWGLVGRIRELCGCRAPEWYRDNGESGVPGGGRGP